MTKKSRLMINLIILIISSIFIVIEVGLLIFLIYSFIITKNPNFLKAVPSNIFGLVGSILATLSGLNTRKILS